MKKQAKPPEPVRILFTRSTNELFVDAPVVYRNGPLAVVPRYRVRTDSNPTVFDVVPKQFTVVHAASGYSAHEPVAMCRREAELACDELTKLGWPALIKLGADVVVARAAGEVGADVRERSRLASLDMAAALKRANAAWKLEAAAATVTRREVRETNAAARLKAAVDAWLDAGGWAGDKRFTSKSEAQEFSETKLPPVKGYLVAGYKWLGRSKIFPVATLSYPVQEKLYDGTKFETATIGLSVPEKAKTP